MKPYEEGPGVYLHATRSRCLHLCARRKVNKFSLSYWYRNVASPSLFFPIRARFETSKRISSWPSVRTVADVHVHPGASFRAGYAPPLR
ncbi:hypothetical protein PUN28_007138 [Cardiocondyla obscurior]|uniref:Uncharacterized protein n=1 Tax=Cardiocondyla obscurior TaxID=286306 RepID=A0AAW2G3M7_9HYME